MLFYALLTTGYRTVHNLHCVTRGLWWFPDCWRTCIITYDLLIKMRLKLCFVISKRNTTILTECDVHYRFRLVVFYYGGDLAVHVGGPGLLRAHHEEKLSVDGDAATFIYETNIANFVRAWLTNSAK